MREETIHATAVEFCGQGVLIRGASGAGKSTLALRLIDAGGVLVSDDRAMLRYSLGILTASPPETIAGLLEIYGVGLRRFPYVPETRLTVVVECAAPSTSVRLPENARALIKDVTLPLYRIDPFEAAAVAKIRAILQTPSAHD